VFVGLTELLGRLDLDEEAMDSLFEERNLELETKETRT
jgi:hypothetical protein